MGSGYYNRKGEQISMMEFAHLCSDPDYKIIARTIGSGRAVSTVWLGLDHQFGSGPPLIFETMVFVVLPSGEWNMSEIDCGRYSTEEEALAGHERMAKDHAYVLDKLVEKLNESDAAEGTSPPPQ